MLYLWFTEDGSLYLFDISLGKYHFIEYKDENGQRWLKDVEHFVRAMYTVCAQSGA